MNKSTNLKLKGQSLVEYSIMLGIVLTLLMAVGPLIKRTVQGMVRTVVDQVGTQQGAEQWNVDKGYLMSHRVAARTDYGKTKTEDPAHEGNAKKYYESQVVGTDSTQIMNLGFTPKKDP